jgi:hypothetical protein
MVPWSARRCRFCKHDVTFADRCHWAAGSAEFIMTAGAFLFGSILGLVVLKVPTPVLSMSIAVVLGFWSTLRTSSTAVPAKAIQYATPASCNGSPRP